MIVAPPGYGKTHLARLLTRKTPAVVVDVHNANSAPDVALQLLSAMISAGLDESGTLRDAIVGLHRSEESTELVFSLVEHEWANATPAATLVIENAEALAQVPETLDRIVAIVDRTAKGSVIVCTRTPVTSRRIQRLSPIDAAHVGPSDLEFSNEETRDLLASCGAASQHIEAVIALCKGWPIAILLFARAALQGDLDAMLARASQSLDLNSYIVSQILSDFNADVLETLGAVMRLGGKVEALEALGMPLSRLDEMTQRHPFFTADYDRNEFLIHPLAQTALRHMNAGISRLTAAAAELENSNPLLAARVYVAIGHCDDAARLLGGVLAPFLTGHLSPALAELVSEIEPASLQKNPAAWCATILFRTYTMTEFERLQEARQVWASLEAHDPIAVRCSVGIILLNYLILLSQYDEAAEVFSKLEQLIIDAESPNAVMLRVYRNLAKRRKGAAVALTAFSEADRQFLNMVPQAHALAAYEFDASAAVYALQPATIRTAFTHAVALAHAADSPTVAIIVLQGAAFFSWFIGDNHQFDCYVDELISAKTPSVELGCRYFIECCRGDPSAARPSNEIHYQRAFASLIAASRANAPDVRAALLDTAHAAAVEDGSPLVLCLAWLAIAFCDPRRRVEAFRNAGDAARQIDGTAWRDAVQAVQRNAGALAAFRARFPLHNHNHHVALAISKRQLSDGDRTITLSPREFEIVVALAVARTTVESRRLGEMLFPEEDPEDAVKCIRVWVNRIRKRAPWWEIVVSKESGYELAAGVRLDILDAEEALCRYERRGSLSNDQEQCLRAVAGAAVHALPERLVDSEWATLLVRRVQDTQYRSLLTLAQLSLERGEYGDALEFSRQAAIQDPIDHRAITLLVAAYERLGDTISAKAAIAAHRQRLREEL